MLKIIILFFISFNIFGKLTSAGVVRIEHRQFNDDDNSSTDDTQTTMFNNVEGEYEVDTFSINYRLFARTGLLSDERNVFKVQDLYTQKSFGEEESFFLSLGYQVFNWSSLELFHPADLVNSKNFDGNLESLEKFGELTFKVAYNLDYGELQFFYFPRMENSRFPKSQSRLGSNVTLNRGAWVEGDLVFAQNWKSQYAVKLNKMLGGFDAFLYFIDHFDRTSPLVGTHEYTNIFGNNIPLYGVSSMNTPYFFREKAYSFGLDKVIEEYILKLEASYKTYDSSVEILTINGLKKKEDIFTLAFGNEYAKELSSGSEITFFLEWQKVFGQDKKYRSGVELFQNDLGLSARYSLNDKDRTEFTLSTFVDLERSAEYIFYLNASRRLTGEWSAKVEARVYHAPKKESVSSGLQVYNKDHFINLSLSRYF